MQDHTLNIPLFSWRYRPGTFPFKPIYGERLCYLFLLFSLCLFFPASLRGETAEYATQFQVPIDAYILKDRATSRVLMEKEIDRQVSPASLTKILTSIMAIESGKLDDDVTITTEATLVEPSKAGFKAGDKVKLIDLVKAAMISSSNDAAFAIAIHLAGNVDTFTAIMNRKAKLIGMNSSWFTNPAGYDKGIYAGNRSTAADLMRLTEYAVKNHVFNSIARLDRAVFMEQTNQKIYSLKTHNKLLEKYPYSVGIKTGFTSRAGKCLIARALRENRDILLVMLNAKTDRWGVAQEMFDNAFTGGPMNPALFVSLNRFDSANASMAAVSGMKSKNGSRFIVKSGRGASKHKELVSRKNSRHSKHAKAAMSGKGRASKNNSLALKKTGKRQKHETLALDKNAKKQKSET